MSTSLARPAPGTYPIVAKQGSLSAMNYKFKEVERLDHDREVAVAPAPEASEMPMRTPGRLDDKKRQRERALRRSEAGAEALG